MESVKIHLVLLSDTDIRLLIASMRATVIEKMKFITLLRKNKNQEAMTLSLLEDFEKDVESTKKLLEQFEKKSPPKFIVQD